MPESTGLTPRQERFVAEYLIDLNATQAAIRAGYSAKTASVIGYELLGKTLVAEAIAAGQAKRAEKLEVSAEWALKHWIDIATADPNELIQYRRGPCPECWGGSEPPSEGEADSACVKCHGDGRGSVFVNDTRKLKGAAKKLYAGVQVGKDGIKVLMRDQDAALVNIARHLGMFKDKIEHSGTVSVATLIEQSYRKTDECG